MKGKIIIWILVMVCLVGSVLGDVNLGVVTSFTLDDAQTDGNTAIDNADSNNATNVGTATTGVTGLIDEAYQFDGTNDYLNVGDPANLEVLDNNFTHNFWANRDSTGNDYTINKRNGQAQYYQGHFIDADTYRVIFSSSGGEVFIECDLAGNFQAGIWYMITARRAGTNFSIFVNGTYCNDEAVSGSLTDNSDDWWIGGRELGGVKDFGGKLDEILFYNRSLSDSEISDLLTQYSNDDQYLFDTTPITSTTDINFTAVDDWDSSSINSFAINVSWENGSVSTHSTTTGTITLLNLSDSNLNINVTYWNVTDYFDLTLYDQSITANTTNSVEANLYQAQVCFNATQKITNSTLVADNYTIGSTTRTECFNLTAGTHTVTANKNDWYDTNLTFSVSALETTTKTVENLTSAKRTIYAIDANSSLYLSNYTINLTSLDYPSWNGEHLSQTTNHSFYLINGSYNIKIDVPGYSLTNSEVNVSVTGDGTYTFNLYVSNVVNITFLEEETNILLSSTNITATLILNGTNSTIKTTDTGYLWFEELTAGNYEVRYSASGYDERSYFFTLQSRTYNELILYLLNNSASQDVRNTLYDEYGNTLEGYIIKLLRYYANTSSFVLVDEGTTNFEGQTVLRAILNNPYYKFRITTADGTILKTTTSTQIYDTSITHYINIGEEIGGGLTELLGVTYSLTYLESTNQYKFTWDNSDGTVVNAELFIYDISRGQNTLFNSSSSPTSSGTMYVSLTPANGTTYKAMAYVTFSGDSEATLLDSKTITFDEGQNTFGRTGLFVTLLIIIAFGLIGVVNPAIPCITIPTALALTRIANLHSLDWYLIVSSFAVGIIILYLIRDKT